MNMENCEVSSSNYSLKREQLLGVLLLLLNSPKIGGEDSSDDCKTCNIAAIGRHSADESKHMRSNSVAHGGGNRLNVSIRETTRLEPSNRPAGNRIEHNQYGNSGIISNPNTTGLESTR